MRRIFSWFAISWFFLKAWWADWQRRRAFEAQLRAEDEAKREHLHAAWSKIDAEALQPGEQSPKDELRDRLHRSF